MSIQKLLHTVDDVALEHVRNYCKVDPHIDDDLLTLEILAARKDIIGQVGDRLDSFFDDNPEFEAAVLIEVFTHYNNRDMDSTADIFKHPAYQNYILSMKADYLEIIQQYGDDYDVGSDSDGSSPT